MIREKTYHGLVLGGPMDGQLHAAQHMIVALAVRPKMRTPTIGEAASPLASIEITQFRYVYWEGCEGRAFWIPESELTSPVEYVLRMLTEGYSAAKRQCPRCGHVIP